MHGEGFPDDDLANLLADDANADFINIWKSNEQTNRRLSVDSIEPIDVEEFLSGATKSGCAESNVLRTTSPSKISRRSHRVSDDDASGLTDADDSRRAESFVPYSSERPDVHPPQKVATFTNRIWRGVSSASTDLSDISDADIATMHARFVWTLPRRHLEHDLPSCFGEKRYEAQRVGR